MMFPRRTFADAIEDVSRGNPKLQQSAFSESGVLPVVDQGQKLIAGYTDDESLRCRVDAPVIVFGDHTRAFKYVDFPFVIGADGVKVLRVRKAWDSKYVYHYLRSRDVPSAGYSRHYKFLKEIEVPQPSLEEQRRIAAILDRADALRAKRHQVLTHLDMLVQAIFHEMFGSMTRAPRWRVAPLGEVAQSRLGKMLDAKAQTGDNARPYLRNANVQWFRLELGDLLSMDFDERDRATFRLEPGDVLVCEGGEPGRSAIWRGELQDCYFQKALHRVRLGGDLSPEYFVHAMWAIVNEGGLKDYVTSATIAHLTGEKLRTLPIAIPPAHLQHEFERKVESLRKVRSHAESALGAETELFASVQSRAFRGEL